MKHKVTISFVIDTDEYEEELTTHDQVGILVDAMLAGQADLPDILDKERIELNVD